jgi:hypothetical protein
MRTGIWVCVGAALAFGAWWVWRPGGTVASVGYWLEHDGCSDAVKIESVHLPLPLPRGFDEAQRRFTNAAREVKYVTCEGLGGSVFYYRFASVADRVRAMAASPAFHRRSTFCFKGTEALYDNLIIGHGLTAKYCTRLHFRIEQPQPPEEG